MQGRILQKPHGFSLWEMKKGLIKKTSEKSTYPPPADGVCVLFLCKPGCSANEPAALAGRGALRAIGSFTDCKVLKRGAVRLHSGAAGDHERGRAGGLGFIGSKI